MSSSSNATTLKDRPKKKGFKGIPNSNKKMKCLSKFVQKQMIKYTQFSFYFQFLFTIFNFHFLRIKARCLFLQLSYIDFVLFSKVVGSNCLLNEVNN